MNAMMKSEAVLITTIAETMNAVSRIMTSVVVVTTAVVVSTAARLPRRQGCSEKEEDVAKGW